MVGQQTLWDAIDILARQQVGMSLSTGVTIIVLILIVVLLLLWRL